MKISKRLQAIADLVPKAHTVIDIGCDHGLLGIYLLLTAKCKHIINTDISENAIKSAKKNVEKYNLEKMTSFFITDGLKEIPYQKEDVIVIAGMGAHTIIDILKKERKSFQDIILSAHKDVPYLRYEIVKMGYKIVEEKAIFDKKWYIIMHVKKGKVNYSEIDYKIGPFVKENEKYIEYLKNKEEEISKKRNKKTEMLLLIEEQKNYHRKSL